MSIILDLNYLQQSVHISHDLIQSSSNLLLLANFVKYGIALTRGSSMAISSILSNYKVHTFREFWTLFCLLSLTGMSAKNA